MARWSIPDDSLVVGITETPEKFEHAKIYIDLHLFSQADETKLEGEQDYRVIKIISNEFQCSFDQFLIEFLNEIHVHNSFRPIPPLLGNGQPVNLKTLFLFVIGKGGYDAVCKNNLWNLVAEKSGLGVNIGSSAKLIYCKYLGTLETWLAKVSDGKVLGYTLIDDGNFDSQLMELQAKVKRLLSDYIAKDIGDEISRIYDFKNEYDFLDGSKLFDAGEVKSKFQDGGFLIDDTITLKGSDGRKIVLKKLINVLDVGDSSENNEVNNAPSLSNGGKEFDNDNDVLILDPSSVNKENFGRKRKRKSIQEILFWVTSIAKTPCDPKVCSILERSKWSSQSNEEIKKQVLLFREAVFMKRNVESSKQHDDWQGTKMHPGTYDDDPAGTTTCNNLNKEVLKSCKRNSGLPKEKFTSVVPDSPKIPKATEFDPKINTKSPHTEDPTEKKTNSLLALEKCSKIAIPKGPAHQAFVPEWTGVTSESDPKWLGTQIWPLKSAKHRLLIDERDPIGKGRDDLCNCKVPGTVECVKSHIAENRALVKLELDVAFYQWNFNKVGEEVSHYWTYEEEKKFKDVLKSNFPAHKKCLWDRIFKSFLKKSREDLVSYYFNVIVLRRRGFQNRHSPNDIDSDDDGLESERLIKPKAIGSSVARKK